MSILGWYSHYLDYRENEIKHERYKNYEVLKEQIASFEDMLIEDDYEIIKFFIEINEDKKTRTY